MLKVPGMEQYKVFSSQLDCWSCVARPFYTGTNRLDIHVLWIGCLSAVEKCPTQNGQGKQDYFSLSPDIMNLDNTLQEGIYTTSLR